MKYEHEISHKSLEDYLVKPGEESPFANLLIDLAFKKAFDPDKPVSRENLINLLNDLLAPQLKRCQFCFGLNTLVVIEEDVLVNESPRILKCSNLLTVDAFRFENGEEVFS